MLEKNCCSPGKKDSMTEQQARMLCRELQNGGITLPDKCIAFHGNRK